MSQPTAMPLPPVQNDDGILERYVDGPIGINFFNGNMHITFITLRVNHAVDPSPQYRQVTLRIVIPLAGAVDLQNQIASLLSILQSQGIIQPIMPGPQTRQ